MNSRPAVPTFLRGSLVAAVVLTVAFAAPVSAQTLDQQNPARYANMVAGPTSTMEMDSRRYERSPNTGLLVVHVFAKSNGLRLDRQAVLKLVDHSTQTARWETTDERAEGVFNNVTYSTYDLEISAVGYLSRHREVLITRLLVEVRLDVFLEPDPAAVNLDIAGAVMSPKARKETKSAVAALKSGKFDQAEKHLDAAYKASPSDPNLNFLLGYLYFQKKDFARAMTYLTASTSVNPHNSQALTLLGRAGLERRDYPAARSALEQAVLADDENWLPHSLLADTYLYEKDYPKARDEAQAAITKGKVAASSAELALGEALLNLGQTKEGVQALSTFLNQSPQHPIAPQVCNLIAELSAREASPAPPASEPAKIPGVDPLLAIPAPKLSIKAWQPPGVDDIQPSVATNVACPIENVLEESGKRAQELVSNVARFSAIEDLFHQSIDDYGNPIRTETRKFSYVASISEPEPGYLAVDEYRDLSHTDYPGDIASTGFSALALVFHPHMRDNFAMTCEGLGDWHGQAAWLVHFRQRDDRPNRMHAYKVGNQLHSVRLKGRAWITADKFQIVRIEAEMISPMPEIQLLSEHQIVEYGPVPFEKKHTTLWLPRSAEIYFDFRKHRYYRRHSFDHYMLYSVDTQEKPKEPAAKPATKPS